MIFINIPVVLKKEDIGNNILDSSDVHSDLLWRKEQKSKQFHNTLGSKDQRNVAPSILQQTRLKRCCLEYQEQKPIAMWSFRSQ